MSAPEIIAVLLSIANVLLVIFRRIENFAFGFAAVVVYAYVFVTAQLYSSAILQVYFVAAQIYGLVDWLRHRTPEVGVAVGRLDHNGRIATAATATLLALALAAGMERWTDAQTPRLDALIASLSIVAQHLLARRRLETWGFWIPVNLLSIHVYATAGLWLTAGLYMLFLAMALWGLREWLRAESSA